MNKIGWLAGITLLLSVQVFALEPRTEHTFRLADGESPPDISLEAMDWIVGNWTGTIFGQQFEEVWNPPSAGSLMGMFKLLNGDELTFYEMQLISKTSEGIALLVKHFNPDFTGWEEKDDYVSFPFIGIEENAIHFSGFSFYRVDDDHMEAWLVLRVGDEVREEKLTYSRNK